MKTMTKNQLNKKLFEDDFFEEMLAQNIHCSIEEFDSELDKDLLSGHDLIEMDG